MSEALSCDVLGWAELEGQQVELLPARTVLSAFGSWNFSEFGDDGGPAGNGGHHNAGGTGVGGNGGDADAVVKDNYNFGGIQINIALAYGGDGGNGYGGDVHANGGDGGHGGNDFVTKK